MNRFMQDVTPIPNHGPLLKYLVSSDMFPMKNKLNGKMYRFLDNIQRNYGLSSDIDLYTAIVNVTDTFNRIYKIYNEIRDCEDMCELLEKSDIQDKSLNINNMYYDLEDCLKDIIKKYSEFGDIYEWYINMLEHIRKIKNIRKSEYAKDQMKYQFDYTVRYFDAIHKFSSKIISDLSIEIIRFNDIYNRIDQK